MSDPVPPAVDAPATDPTDLSATPVLSVEPAPAEPPAPLPEAVTPAAEPSSPPIEPGDPMDADPAPDEADPVAALRSRHDDLIRRYDELTGELADLRVRLADGHRERELDRLAGEVAVDLDAERARCLAGRGSTMSDEAFDRHVAAIRQYARPLPTGRFLPRGTAPPEALSPDAEAAVAARAVAIAETRRRAGRPTDWRTAWEAALAERT